MRLIGLLLGGAVVLGLVLFGVDKLNEPGETAAERSGLDSGSGTPNPNPAPAAPAAQGEACLEAVRDIRAAEQTYHGQNLRYADVPTLVRAGNLGGISQLYVAESSDGWATYRLVGLGVCPTVENP